MKIFLPLVKGRCLFPLPLIRGGWGWAVELLKRSHPLSISPLAGGGTKIFLPLAGGGALFFFSLKKKGNVVFPLPLIKGRLGGVGLYLICSIACLILVSTASRLSVTCKLVNLSTVRFNDAR